MATPGPYTKPWREHWLRRVLEAQESVRREGPPEFGHLQLITLDELHEIRRIWLYEKHEFDDRLPRIYEEVTGQQFPRQTMTAMACGRTIGRCCGRPAATTRRCSISRSPCWASSASIAA
jgi:hypothetical protein